MQRIRLALTALSLTTLAACGGKSLSEQANDFGGRGSNNANQQLPPVTDILDRSPPVANSERNAYFGDLHVHTEYSFDVDSFRKHCLLNGLDDIALTLQKDDKISGYEEKLGTDAPWVAIKSA